VRHIELLSSASLPDLNRVQFGKKRRSGSASFICATPFRMIPVNSVPVSWLTSRHNAARSKGCVELIHRCYTHVAKLRGLAGVKSRWINKENLFPFPHVAEPPAGGTFWSVWRDEKCALDLRLI
jgi:hypothetical protein